MKNLKQNDWKLTENITKMLQKILQLNKIIKYPQNTSTLQNKKTDSNLNENCKYKNKIHYINKYI